MRGWTDDGARPQDCPYLNFDRYEQYRRWNDTPISAGCLFRPGQPVEFVIIYKHQNNTG